MQCTDEPHLSRRAFLRLAGAAAAVTMLPAQAAPGTLMRPIPSSGERIPAVGLGSSRTFDVGRSIGELQPLAEVLRLFVASGGRVIDTSPMYGRAEAVIGKLAAAGGLADELFFATKVWTDGREAGIGQMRQSMERLQRPVIDLVQVHNLVDWRTHLDTLSEWKAEGLVRYVGITHYRSDAFDQLAEVIESRPVDFVQLNYSLAEPEAERRLLPLAHDRGVAVMVNRPFARGELFRKVRAHALPAWAAEWGCESWAQLFLKYILGHGAVTCVIPATSRPKHLRDNMQAGFGPLPDEAARQRMRAALAAL